MVIFAYEVNLRGEKTDTHTETKVQSLQAPKYRIEKGSFLSYQTLSHRELIMGGQCSQSKVVNSWGLIGVVGYYTKTHKSIWHRSQYHMPSQNNTHHMAKRVPLGGF